MTVKMIARAYQESGDYTLVEVIADDEGMDLAAQGQDALLVLNGLLDMMEDQGYSRRLGGPEGDYPEGSSVEVIDMWTWYMKDGIPEVALWNSKLGDFPQTYVYGNNWKDGEWTVRDMIAKGYLPKISEHKEVPYTRKDQVQTRAGWVDGVVFMNPPMRVVTVPQVNSQGKTRKRFLCPVGETPHDGPSPNQLEAQ